MVFMREIGTIFRAGGAAQLRDAFGANAGCAGVIVNYPVPDDVKQELKSRENYAPNRISGMVLRGQDLPVCRNLPLTYEWTQEVFGDLQRQSKGLVADRGYVRMLANDHLNTGWHTDATFSNQSPAGHLHIIGQGIEIAMPDTAVKLPFMSGTHPADRANLSEKLQADGIKTGHLQEGDAFIFTWAALHKSSQDRKFKYRALNF